ncbi:MAG: 23S rRNA (pseudouridine(1915)-N(3))-methyltransferase RlmH [Bacteroidota bacterium]
MKVALWVIGKTNEAYLREGIGIYQKRLSHYLRFELEVLPESKGGKSRTPEQLKQQEGDLILKKLAPQDFLILLDERGKGYDSVAFAQYLERLLVQSPRRIVFVVGGAYGFSPAVYERANARIRLSQLTFSHQMVRLFFVEQLYRAMTILRGEPYHNA